MSTIIREKLCPSCGVIKSLEKFENHKRTKDGKSSRCKKCYMESTKKYLIKQGAISPSKYLKIKPVGT
jgi:hypothetical protein